MLTQNEKSQNAGRKIIIHLTYTLDANAPLYYPNYGLNGSSNVQEFVSLTF
jgi:hypothetical protein